MFVLKYLMPNMGYLELLIISLLFVTAFLVISKSTKCVKKEQFDGASKSNGLSINDVLVTNTTNNSSPNSINQPEIINKIKLSNPFNTNLPGSMGQNINSHTYLPPENWFKPYECLGETYLNKARVEPIDDPITAGLLAVDYTAPVQKINVNYLSKILNQDG